MESLTFHMCQEVEQSLQRSYEDWGSWGRREGQNLEDGLPRKSCPGKYLKFSVGFSEGLYSLSKDELETNQLFKKVKSRG